VESLVEFLLAKDPTNPANVPKIENKPLEEANDDKFLEAPRNSVKKKSSLKTIK
jgi:hypothetical protein